MRAEITIDIDVVRSLVRTRLAGFFDDAAIADFLAQRRQAFQRLRCAPNQHLSLTDVRDMAIQTQSVVSRWHQVLADPGYRSRKLAFVVASTLARMQLQRAIGSRDAQVFTDPGEAERWVLTESAKPRTP